MKAFLIVAGLLMTGASVYGIVDYNKKTKSREFNELYKEKPVETVVTEETTVPVVEKKEALKTKVVTKIEKEPVKKLAKKKKEKERVFRFKEFSRAPLRD